MNEKSKAPLVMLEQMVMLLVFALAAALCLQAFVRSDAASRKIEARDQAVNLCQSMAELLRTNGGDIGGAIEQVFRGYPSDSSPLPLKEDMTPAAGSEETAFYLNVVPLNVGIPGLAGALVQITTPDGAEFFSLDVTWQVEVTA